MTESDTETTDPVIRLEGVDFAWPGGGFRLQVPAFDVGRGESVFLVGASGSGKTTLLSLICGIVTPQAGRISVAGRDLEGLSVTARDRHRAESVGVIFQMFNLLPYATGLDNILLPLRFAPERRRRCPDPRRAALELSARLGLTGDLMTGMPARALSVGQQQRVAVARAMIGSPPLIVADEPTSALDAAAQADFIDLLFDQASAAGAALVLVSHDERLAARFDRVVALGDIARTERRAAS